MGFCNTTNIDQEVETREMGIFQVSGTFETEDGYVGEQPLAYYEIQIEPIDLDARLCFDEDYEACKQAVVAELNKIDWEV